MATTGGPSKRPNDFKKLRALQCFNEVYERILAGWSMNEIAKFIQQQKGEYTQISHNSLSQTLARFRSTIPPGELVGRRMPAEFTKKVEEAKEELDALEELIWLAKLQRKRLEIDHRIEEGIKTLKPSMTNEMRVAKDILNDIAQLKMDLGMNTRHLGQVGVVEAHIDLGRYEKESVKVVMENPERRRKVLGIAERLLALPGRAQKAAEALGTIIDAEVVSEDGDDKK